MQLNASTAVWVGRWVPTARSGHIYSDDLTQIRHVQQKPSKGENAHNGPIMAPK